ncbi:pyridine nucleotide-disulfide oxidoreductase family protein [Collimonas arenae]|uniref:Pyridine nucleotide-disulfide oxidoreductase family protein n=1 Tax=Collimonas arenae TaxID=279058 RepID=A0A127QI24_9BURK|nr:hydroxysqualene dehydroxylase HpnE [Collimonas arenae]AMP09710.1 pyridine nucleotide-disulfide oxidoreductase family protein [Collimonas arenae]
MAINAKQVAVIGAGWAGCTAAVELTAAGHQVTLFEASRQLGGRARRVDINELTLDNGQHILLGAYKDSLGMMRKVGIDLAAAMLRLPLQMCYPSESGGMTFVAPRLPAPLHLLVALWRAQGLDREDKLALARFSSAARWMGWQLHDDCSVSTLLERFDQTDRLIQLMWRPLCIAALNTRPEQASAQVFLAVLRDSLGAKRSASDMLLPRIDLSSLYPQQAAAFVEERGGNLETGCSIRQLRRHGEQWQLDSNDTSLDFDAVVIATPPETAAGLLDGIADATLVSHLRNFEYEPITTCYLQYSRDFRLPRPFFALIDTPPTTEPTSVPAWGQFVFDRGQLDPAQAGLLAIVISASSDAIQAGHEALAQAVAAQLATAFKQPELASPNWARVISEKRATFACTPALARPANDSGLERLLLAGDYTASDYPATLESAVRSGKLAAQQLVKQLR